MFSWLKNLVLDARGGFTYHQSVCAKFLCRVICSVSDQNRFPRAGTGYLGVNAQGKERGVLVPTGHHPQGAAPPLSARMTCA